MQKKDVNFSEGNSRFNFRVAIYLENNGRILLHKSPAFDFWNMPGGRVKMGETTRQAIIREIEEELELQIDELNLIHVGENIFEWQGLTVQELLFVYYANIGEDDYPITKQQDFLTKDCVDEINHWFKKEEIKTLTCKPSLIYDLGENTDKLTHSTIIDI